MSNSFCDLPGRLRAGDENAAELVFRLYATRLIGLARSRLDARLRGKLDPEDVAQSVFKSFFVGARHGEYDLEDWDSLWSLLTVITLRKCGYQARQFRTARRDARKEFVPSDHTDAPTWEAVSHVPTPEEAFELTDLVEELFHGLDATDQQILALSLQGGKPDDVARAAGVAERTVYRVLERVKGKLTRKTDSLPFYG